MVERLNRYVLAAFGPVLVLTGLVGLVFTQADGLMSQAVPYDWFHVAFGVLGSGLVLARSVRGIAAFNLGFGCIDLYQAAAGYAGWFPADWFALQPGDHLVHIGVGLPLACVGALGLRALNTDYRRG
jgi:hypothetical protein